MMADGDKFFVKGIQRCNSWDYEEHSLAEITRAGHGFCIIKHSLVKYLKCPDITINHINQIDQLSHVIHDGKAYR